MKNILIALFLLVALTVDVPANDIFIDNGQRYEPVPVEVKTNYSKYRVSVATSNDVIEPSRCGLTDSQINHNAVARMMKRTVPYVNSCNVIYVINK